VAVDTAAITALVSKYEALTERERRSYKEAETRTNFIDLLFLALGWDVYDRNEVEREPMIRSGFADYAFKVGGAVRFYMEAKPLEDNLYKEDYARKAITYAYNKGVSWAVLCSFAGLQVFNAEWQTTDLNKARVLNLTWRDFGEAGSPLLLLSKDALLEGELETHAQKWGGMKPRLPVEKSLFEQMRRWRSNLFSQVKAYRGDLNLQQVDEAVLRLLNRLIFIRSCEDRHIEEVRLRTAANQWKENGYQPQLVEILRTIFREFDVNYDSDLFNLALADQVFVENIALRDIIDGLYAPPLSLAAYDFSIMDSDVLGQVYEQYLGYVATEVKTQGAKQRNLSELGFEIAPQEFQAKRLKRKAHGIYYTPKWVVDYIVKQTVGRYLEEHSHDEILNMTILDPSCGSGSFLIGAFEGLIAYHAGVEGKSPRDLGKARRWQILTGNVFGVDLDQQAVDIARLNLLLRAVARRELLPGLQDSVVRGNSLIWGSREELRRYFGRRWREKQAFDWEEQFARVMERGGFDVIVGNPPYVRIQTLDREEVDFYNDKYEAATGSYDLYCLFVERGLQLLKPGGRLGFIVPNKFFGADYGKGLRRLLCENKAVEQVVDFGDAQVFDAGTNYTCLLFLVKDTGQRFSYVWARDAVAESPAAPDLSTPERSSLSLDRDEFGRAPWVFPRGSQSSVVSRLAEKANLSGVAERVFQGVITGADKIFVLRDASLAQADECVFVKSDATRQMQQIEKAILKPMVKGSRHIHRYSMDKSNLLLLFPYAHEGGSVRLLTQNEMETQFPKAWEYLNERSIRQQLVSRENGRMVGSGWYAYSRIQNMLEFEKPKILVPYMVNRVCAHYDETAGTYLVNVTTGGYGVSLRRANLWPLVLAILNSRLAHFWLKLTATRHAGDYYGCTSTALNGLPFPNNVSEGFNRSGTGVRLKRLVDRMVELRKRLGEKEDVRDEERAQIERETERTDREIDDLVYDLYELTGEERAIVEEEFAL
jgi:type I restriction-modification system DNA methylase subunit